MKILKRTPLAIALLVITVGATHSAYADDAEWYVGAGVGRTQSKLDNGRLARELNAPGFVSAAVYGDDHDTAYKAFGGYQFFRYFALEGSYFDLGKFSFSAPAQPSGGLRGDLRVRGFGLDAVGKLPITGRLAAYAKIGETYAQTRDEFSGTGGDVVSNPSPRVWRANPKVGAGLQYMITPHLGVRGEWERYRISDGVNDHGNVDGVFMGLVYAMGRDRPAAPMPVAAYTAPPAAIEQPRAPEPEVVAPPPRPAAPRRVSFSADTLFSFDSAVVRPAGTEQLDRFAAELKDMRFERVRVLGYADRIGSAQYNQRLSERRAQSVKDYLVSAGAVDAAKVVAEGKGSSDPVTAIGQCGTRRSKETIACLQPDRRVDVEVSGSER